MSEKPQVQLPPPPPKKQWKVISIEEKSEIINQLKIDECIANICCALGLAKSTIRTICVQHLPEV
jgi:hypothetical protein